MMEFILWFIGYPIIFYIGLMITTYWATGKERKAHKEQQLINLLNGKTKCKYDQI